MRRREFISLLGGAAAWPLAVRAQQATKLPTIGYLGTASASAWAPWTAAFVQQLRELGWVEGRTVAIQYRWADGRAERWTEIAAGSNHDFGRFRTVSTRAREAEWELGTLATDNIVRHSRRAEITTLHEVLWMRPRVPPTPPR
jgi:hypothetical protein